MPVINNAIYDHVAHTWWDEDGFMSLLRTAINPPRFAYFEQALTGILQRQPAGLTVLDVGCGGGLLSERFAALGCQVTGLDRAAAGLVAARAHAEASGLRIDYQQGSAEQLPFADQQFDIVCCCDVLEHVDDVDAVLAEIARVLKPGGVFFFDTINRTLRSKLLAIKLAQDWPLTRLMPADVHVWHQFIRPQELQQGLARHGLGQVVMAGLSPVGNPLRPLWGLLLHKLGRLSFAGLGERIRLGATRDMSVSYMGYALREAVVG